MTTEALIDLTGTVAERRAQMQPVGTTGDARPVLHITLTNCGPLGKRVTAQQVFPVGAIAACHARAAQLQVGTVVSVQAPVSQVQLHLPEVQHIHIVQPHTQQEPAHA